MILNNFFKSRKKEMKKWKKESKRAMCPEKTHRPAMENYNVISVVLPKRFSVGDKCL